MQATNFMYDGIYLSDFGFVVCDFNNGGDLSAVSGGSVITFNKISHYSGRRFSLSSTKYAECLTATFDICKDPDKYNDIAISDDECRNIFKWLNRREFLKLQFVDDCNGEQTTCYYNASFNIDKIMVDGNTYGLRLKVETDMPYGYGKDIDNLVIVSAGDTEGKVELMSDEIGSISPTLVITCKSAGTFILKNKRNGTSLQIKNCISGEVITFDGFTHQIMSSVYGHDIANDFSYGIFRLENTYSDPVNVFTASMPCDIHIKYTPIIKLPL